MEKAIKFFYLREKTYLVAEDVNISNEWLNVVANLVSA